MKRFIFLIFIISLSHGDPRGKLYERDRVCQEFAKFGTEKFSAMAVIMNSRKYSNATFEEIGHLVKALGSLVATCCAKGAAADCYDNRASALSAKSCDPKSPFPKHPGVGSCCLHKGLERKLCLADLKQPPKEFPTFVEQSNEEACNSFKTDAQTFSTRFLYEYSSNYAQTPLPVILNSTENYLSMVKDCCTSDKSTSCFLRKKLERQPLHLLTVMSNRLCSRFASYGEDKLKLSASIMFSQKVPSADFKDVMTLAEQGTQVLANSCGFFTEKNIENELSEHVKQVCHTLSKDERISACCKKSSIDALLCLHSMPAAEPIKLSTLQLPTSEKLCKKGKNQELNKYMYELARRNTKLPEVFIDKLYESMADVIQKCCSSENANSCLQKKKTQLSEEIKTYISEGNELCGDYNKYQFSEFKARIIKTFSSRTPKLTSKKAEELAEERANLASTCCIINAPPVYCKEKINKVFRKLCNREPCILQ
ncbi:vitamin D-binding protein [Bufo bufo]|uniref:vitamin D-binding protein n=1 Tax=Bufo bufo TaxID=8384 RepID=UPI001ABEE675|nr:vitamin D-binding protein [Bufo bufo]